MYRNEFEEIVYNGYRIVNGEEDLIKFESVCSLDKLLRLYEASNRYEEMLSGDCESYGYRYSELNTWLVETVPGIVEYFEEVFEEYGDKDPETFVRFVVTDNKSGEWKTFNEDYGIDIVRDVVDHLARGFVFEDCE